MLGMFCRRYHQARWQYKNDPISDARIVRLARAIAVNAFFEILKCLLQMLFAQTHGKVSAGALRKSPVQRAHTGNGRSPRKNDRSGI